MVTQDILKEDLLTLEAKTFGSPSKAVAGALTFVWSVL